MLEVKGDSQERMKVRRVHAGTCAEVCPRRFALRRASARVPSLRMTATRADLGCLPQSRRRWQKAAGLVVGEVAGESAGVEIRVEPARADVNAGCDGGHAARRRWPGSSRAARYTVRVRVLRVLDLRRSETPAPAADSQDH